MLDADSVDESLILICMAAYGDGQGLLVRLGDERGRAHIRHPDLDGTHATGAEARAMPPNALGTRQARVSTDHGAMLRATAPSAMQGRDE
jgi:hypothetical protein